jgi:tetratricopeptide (TPR) repeat protein
VSRYTRLRPRDPNGWLLWDQVALSLGRESEAILRQGLDSNPNSIEIAARLTRVLLANHKNQEARELIEIMARLDPQSPYLFVCSAMLARRQGDLQAMRRFATKVEELVNERDCDQVADCLVGLAATLELGGEIEWAKSLFLRAAKGPCEYASPHLQLAVLLEAEDPTAAAFHLERARALWIDNEELLEEDLRRLREGSRSRAAHPDPDRN